MFNCLSRLYRPSAGSITFAGRELLRLKPHEVVHLGMARTFQNVALFGSMSVLDNVLVGQHSRIASGPLASALRLGRARRAEGAAVERALQLLDVMGLLAQASSAAGGLPFALQKRVELARALAAQPALLLLDEPGGGLNHTELGELRELIARIHADYALTVLLVEHHMNLVMRIADHVVVLDSGRKIAEGPPAVVQASPIVVEAFLGTDATLPQPSLEAS